MTFDLHIMRLRKEGAGAGNRVLYAIYIISSSHWQKQKKVGDSMYDW